ncbi:MAG: HAD family phosphatase [Alphaproteobacteria bacterium]|nr:HAD family phosphatase [Alphaproteobacteria bacterium]
MAGQGSPGTVKALLFDIGNVILSIDVGRAAAHWPFPEPGGVRDFAAALAEDPVHHRYERGEIDDAAFFAHLRGLLDADLSDTAIRAGWNSIFAGPVPGVEAVLAQARGKYPLYALSNTNNAHAAHFLEAYAELFAAFDTLFLSHRIGGRKPEPAAFEHVAQAVGLTPAEILLFDDLDANIAAARALGFQTVHVTGPAATEAPAARL